MITPHARLLVAIAHESHLSGCALACSVMVVVVAVVAVVIWLCWDELDVTTGTQFQRYCPLY
jgi:hypothetical protein